jgi:calcitonin receptor-like
MKAVRATLILVPLLGIEFVLIPWRPEGKIAEEIYDYIINILMHYQVWCSCIRKAPCDVRM